MVAAYHASDRLERLEALGCDAVSSGSDTPQSGYELKWTVDGDAAAQVRHVQLTATYPGFQGRVRANVFEKAIPCVR
jgi:hypothetical protein